MTFPLSIILPAIIGGLVGFTSASLQETMRRRRRLRTLAAALDVERQRIRDELMVLRTEPDDYAGVSTQAPSVHRWLEKVIVDSSELDARIVAEFLLLERILHNTGVHVEVSRKAERRAADTGKALEAATASGDGRAVADLKLSLVPLQQHVAIARGEVGRSADAAFHSLTQIESLLRPFLPSRK